MIRILSIGHSEEGGGLQTVFRINNSISNSNVQVITAFHSEQNSIADIELDRTGDYRNPIKRILGYFFIPKNYFNLSNYLKNNEVDIIHLHSGVSLSLGIIHAIKKYKGNAKIILTAHGHGLVCPTYSCYCYGKRNNCHDCIYHGKEFRSIKNKCDRRGYLYSLCRYIDFVIRKRITENYLLYDCVITPSNYLGDVLINSRHKFNQIKVVPNPIEVECNVIDYSEKKDIITFVGRFSKEKNVNLLIDAFSKIINIDKYRNLKLHILGDGVEKQNYINKLKEYNIENNVYISEKFLTRDELQKHLLLSKTLVLPSVCPETFGIVLFEGIRYGLIPISLNIGAQAENILNLDCGILYETSNVESLQSAILESINKYDYLIKKVEYSNEIIDRKFSVEEYKNNIMSVYYETLGLGECDLEKDNFLY